MSEHKPLRRRRRSQRYESPLSASATARPRWSRACSTTYDADENSAVPGLMHVKFGQYHVRDVKFVAAFDVDAKKVGFDLSEAIFASENNTIKIADVPPTNVTGAARPDARRHRQVLRRHHRVVRRRAGRRGQGAQGEQGRRAGVLPAGGLRGGRQVLRAVRHRRGRGVRQRACRCSSPRTRCGPRSSPTPACRSSATTSRARSAPPSPTA